jgi:hypothetical protein
MEREKKVNCKKCGRFMMKFKFKEYENGKFIREGFDWVCNCGCIISEGEK